MYSHHVGSNVSPCTAQSGLAVHSNRSRLLLAGAQEALQDVVCGVAPVLVEEVHMADTSSGKYILVIALLIEADDTRHPQGMKQRYICLRRQRVQALAYLATLRHWTTEGNELARHQPRYVSVLQLRQLIVLLNIESIIIEVI